MNPLLEPVAAVAARLLVRANSKTHRLDAHGLEYLEQLEGQPCVLAYWHSQLLASLSFVFRELLSKGRLVTVMISQSRDGELVTKIVKTWGLRVHRGSATRGGSRALRGLYRELAKENASPIMLVDGPQGPARVAKPGAIVLSQTTGAPLLPMAFVAARGIALGSWDRMVWPLPLTRIAVEIGQPLQIPRELGVEERTRWQGELADVLNGLEAAARLRL